MTTPPIDKCPFCRRQPIGLTKHHLIPRAYHQNKRIRRLYHRDYLVSHVVWICRDCHNHIHKVLTEKQMAFDYDSAELLINNPDVKSFCDWLSRKPPGFKPKP